MGAIRWSNWSCYRHEDIRSFGAVEGITEEIRIRTGPGGRSGEEPTGKEMSPGYLRRGSIRRGNDNRGNWDGRINLGLRQGSLYARATAHPQSCLVCISRVRIQRSIRTRAKTSRECSASSTARSAHFCVPNCVPNFIGRFVFSID